MSEPLIDPFFFEGLRPVWTGVALGYGLASVYLRFGVDEACPTWAWSLFFAIGGAMFLVINGEHWFDPGMVLTTIEIGAVAALAAGGYALFWLVLQWYDLPTPRERCATGGGGSGTSARKNSHVQWSSALRQSECYPSMICVQQFGQMYRFSSNFSPHSRQLL